MLNILILIIFCGLMQVTFCYKHTSNLNQNISVQLQRLKLGPISIYFGCPNIESKEDIALFYKVDSKEKILLSKKNETSIIIKLKSKLDFGIFECSVTSKYKIERNATLNILDMAKVKSPIKYIYDNSETIYIFKEGGSVEMDCGSKGDEEVTWYKPAPFHVFTGKRLKIERLTNYTYGTYYCAIGNTAKEVLNVKKIILLSKNTNFKESSIDEDVKYFDNVIPKGREIRYLPGQVTDKTDIVTWEQPPGTILLEQGRELYFQSYSIKQTKLFFYYRINRNGDCLFNKVGKVIISQWEDEEIQLSVEGLVSYGAKMKVNCFPLSKSVNNSNVIWRRNDKIIHRGFTYIIERYQLESFGNYSCEIENEGRERIRRNINLTPMKDIHSMIEMKTVHGEYYSFYYGKYKELYCKILRERGVKKYTSKDVIWTFQGRIIENENSRINVKLERRDSRSASILVLRNMDQSAEGTYKCSQGFTVFTVHLIMEREDILLKVSPDVETVTDNVNDFVEFICQIDTYGLTSNLIKWSYMTNMSKYKEPFPKEAKIKSHSLSTSHLTIENTLKRHEGIYICQVFNKKVFGKLIVRSNSVSTIKSTKMSPKPFHTSTFLCQWSNKTYGIKNRMENTIFECNVKIEMENMKKEMKEVKEKLNKKEIKMEGQWKRSKEETENLKKELRKYQEETDKKIKLMNEESDKGKKVNEDQNKEIVILKEIILLKEMNYWRRKCDKGLNDSECTKWIFNDTKVDFVWKIERISQRRGTNPPKVIGTFLHSEPFYSNNYKLQLCLFLYFDGMIKFGFRIMKGDYDERVQWPLRFAVGLSFRDQVSLEVFKSETLKYDTYLYKRAFERPQSDTGNNYIIWGEVIRLKDCTASVTVEDSLIVTFMQSS